jgi:alkylhydroperoxidase family enzyme
VPEACFDQVKAVLPQREILELVVTIAGYNCVSRVLEALQINGADKLS